MNLNLTWFLNLILLFVLVSLGCLLQPDFESDLVVEYDFESDLVVEPDFTKVTAAGVVQQL